MKNQKKFFCFSDRSYRNRKSHEIWGHLEAILRVLELIFGRGGVEQRPKMGVLVRFYRRRDRFSDPKICFFAFFEAKMTKNDIPNPKLIDPNDNQPFYIRILRFF